MINLNDHLEEINSPVRKIEGKVELYNGSTLINAFYYTDALKSFDIERVGEGKFFGYGYCQRANIKLIDKERELNITTANSFKIYLGTKGNYINPFPIFYVTEVNRDEKTNELSITAYDALNKAATHTVEELGIYSYSISEFATSCANLLGVNLSLKINDNSFSTVYEDGANFSGSETIREALTAIAEATQTIYFLDYENNLVFKRLDREGAAVDAINKSKYFSLDSKTNRRLAAITHATELGDNVTASMTETGTTQYVRNNPFWDLREDIGTLVDNALDVIGGLTINQFNCQWRGNYLLELGDKLSLTTKDNGEVITFLLNDTISYNGIFSEKTEWTYEEEEEEASNNPTSLGDVLNQTFARVDKANKEIELLVSETNANTDAISSLQINTESINASIQSIEKNNKDSIDNLEGEIETLTNRVNATMTSDEIKLEIRTEIDNGVSKVQTNTGFTFDDAGLTVRRSDSDITTNITEDGMRIYKNDENVLVADNTGVKATNLYATTFLIIGGRSRFEDFEENGEERTGCFWIGN